MADLAVADTASNKVVLFGADYLTPEVNSTKFILLLGDGQGRLKCGSLLDAEHNSSEGQLLHVQ